MKKKVVLHLMAIMMVPMLSVGFYSCSSDDDDDIDTSPISVLAGKDHTIVGADTIASSNKFVAYGNKNVVHGWHVGEAKLVVNGKKTIDISVQPVYHLYDDPVCNWGCDQNIVKFHQRQGKLSSKSNSNLLAYEDAGAASILAYNFENGKLKSILAVVSTKYTSQYSSFLAERYLMLPYYKGENMYFIGADGISLEDAKTVAAMQVYSTSQLVTMYFPAKDYLPNSSINYTNAGSKVIKFLKDNSIFSD